MTNVSQVFTRGPWQVIYKITSVLCPDGTIRTASISGPADTYFSLPGRIKVKGKTVTGFVWTHSDGSYRFTADKDGKNYSLVGPWNDSKQ
jgi:hypothetical protein